MASDVAQWLIEIRTLQRRLVETSGERDAAFKSAANWRRLYETEAQQRRAETQQLKDTVRDLQQTIEDLNARDTDLTGSEQLATKDDNSQQDLTQFKLEISKLDREVVSARLIEALLRCDRLAQSLQSEQIAHAQTRKSLTMALGDTIDMLSRSPSRSLAETASDSNTSHQQGPPS